MAPGEPEFPEVHEGGSSGFPWTPRSQYKSPQQSPIDICTCNCKAMNYRPLRVNYAKTDRRDGIVVELSNSGHGVTMKVPRSEARPSLIGGMLPNAYTFDNIHCHWGKDDIMGSEHFINGESYSMECHMVTYNSKYKDLNDALSNKNDQDSVVVYTWFYKVKNEDNMKLQQFLNYIPHIRDNGTKINPADQDALLWFLEPIPANKEYFAYPGSLTTSPFTPSVTFIILPVPVGISRNQLAVLRTMMDNHNPSKPVLTNRREIQTLNKRPVVCVKGTIQMTARLIQAEATNDV